MKPFMPEKEPVPVRRHAHGFHNRFGTLFIHGLVKHPSVRNPENYVSEQLPGRKTAPAEKSFPAFISDQNHLTVSHRALHPVFQRFIAAGTKGEFFHPGASFLVHPVGKPDPGRISACKIFFKKYT